MKYKSFLLIILVCLCILCFTGCEKKEVNKKNLIEINYSDIEATASFDKNNKLGFKDFAFSEKDKNELNFSKKDCNASFKMYFTLYDISSYNESYDAYKKKKKFKNFKTEKYSGFFFTDDAFSNYAYLVLEVEKNDEFIYLLNIEAIDNNLEADEYLYDLFDSDDMKSFINSIDVKIDYDKYVNKMKSNIKGKSKIGEKESK